MLRLGVQQQDVILKNSQPLVVDITKERAQFSPAQFTGRDTNVSVQGAIPFQGAAGADFSVRGNINLVILQLINPDLAAKGNANLQVSIRGNLQDPNVNGRLELTKASLSYSDLPYVVDNADGSITFDRNRATIERLTAETSGGTITFTGSLDFGAALDSGTALVYRLQAEARQRARASAAGSEHHLRRELAAYRSLGREHAFRDGDAQPRFLQSAQRPGCVVGPGFRSDAGAHARPMSICEACGSMCVSKAPRTSKWKPR